VALRVRLLGGLDVEGVEHARLGSRKARRLVGRLALGRGRPVPADTLVEVLWPGPDRPSRPGDQLSVLVSRLRSVLDTARLPRVGTGYALHQDWLDVDALPGLVGEARRRLAVGAVAPARVAIDAALALDRGVLLPDEPPSDWLDAERGAAARAAVAAGLVSAEVALAARDAWAAADAAWAVLAREPYDEAAVRLLMVGLAASGRPAQAVTVYTELAVRLRDELGVDPAPETTAAYLQLLRAEPVTVADPVPAAGTRAHLPGRAAQLRALDDAYTQASTGAAVLVTVEGEAGIGKTRLLDTWVDGLPGDGTVLRASGWELGGGLPLQPVLDAVAVRLRRLDAERAARLLDGPAAFLAPLVGAPQPRADPAGQADLANPFGSRALPLLGEPTGAGHTLLFAALDAVLSGLAADGPVTLIIDDSHWLDRTTVAWLGRVRVRLADVALLVVLARRPDEGDRPPAATRSVALGPLDESATAEVVGAGRAAELYARSGGHPLFLAELAHAADGALPESIRAAVAERCERAGEAAATIRWAAVLGPDIDLDLLAAALDRPPGQILDHVEEGVRRHLLVERNTGFQFRHQLIRDALRAEVGASRSAWLHRQAARSLEARGSQCDPLDVAYHARLGGDLVRTAQALADAAEVAAARFEHDAALDLFDEALAAHDAPALRLRRARVALPAGRFEEAVADATHALAAAGADAMRSEAMEVVAIAAYCLRDFPTCRRLADEGARLAEDPRLRTSLLALGGRVRHVDGDLDGARQRLRIALDTAAPGMRALAGLWYAPLQTDSGDPAAALELLRDPTLVQAARHPFVLPHRHLAAAQAFGMLGQVREALAELDAVDRAATEQRTARFAARADNCRAWLLRNLGDADAADARNQAAYERSIGAIGMREPVADALLGLADGRLRAGQPAAARRLLERVATETAVSHPFAWRHELRAALLAGRCALAEGDRPGAARVADDVLARAVRLGQPRYQVLARLLGALAGAVDADVEADVDVDQVRRDLGAVEQVAPLEAWWLTAELAEALDVQEWRELAAARQQALQAAR
jgi:DNA-binding SARP family transcriptional activator